MSPSQVRVSSQSACWRWASLGGGPRATLLPAARTPLAPCQHLLSHGTPLLRWPLAPPPPQIVRYYEAAARWPLAASPSKSRGLGFLLRCHLGNG